MIISFDIDNTLIPYSDEFLVEEPNFIWKLLGAENLRLGFRNLYEELSKREHDIWIYTTSFRSPFSLKKTFAAQGMYPSKFINEEINRKKLRQSNCKASKNPKLFGIDLHIDDSKGVVLEGEKLNFDVLYIDPNDEDWVKKVLAQVDKMQHISK